MAHVEVTSEVIRSLVDLVEVRSQFPVRVFFDQLDAMVSVSLDFLRLLLPFLLALVMLVGDRSFFEDILVIIGNEFILLLHGSNVIRDT